MKRKPRWIYLLLVEMVILILLGAVILPVLDPVNPGRVTWQWQRLESATIELPASDPLGGSNPWTLENARQWDIHVVDNTLVAGYALAEVPDPQNAPVYQQGTWRPFPGLAIDHAVKQSLLFLHPSRIAYADSRIVCRVWHPDIQERPGGAVEHAYELRVHLALPVAVLLLIPLAVFLYWLRKARRARGFPVITAPAQS